MNLNDEKQRFITPQPDGFFQPRVDLQFKEGSGRDLPVGLLRRHRRLPVAQRHHLQDPPAVRLRARLRQLALELRHDV